MATPHIESKLEDIAEVVLMPGDPLRAKYIAENFLEDAKPFVLAKPLEMGQPLHKMVSFDW